MNYLKTNVNRRGKIPEYDYKIFMRRSQNQYDMYIISLCHIFV